MMIFKKVENIKQVFVSNRVTVKLKYIESIQLLVDKILVYENYYEIPSSVSLPFHITHLMANKKRGCLNYEVHTILKLTFKRN